jgi:hypothetical protein
VRPIVPRRRAALVASAWLLAAGVSRAAPPDGAGVTAPAPERIRSAAEEFDKGRRSFLAKEFEQAALHFENAYRDAPRAESLRLAIRSRREARQLARAATYAAMALERYADDAPTVQLAKDVLAEASPASHDLTVECRSACSLTEGGRVLSDGDAVRHRVFLDAGPHAIGVAFAQGAVTLDVVARPGGRDVFPVSSPPERVSPPPPVAPSKPATPFAARGNKPFGPVVFFVAAGVTLAVAGATVASGIDTQNNPGADAVRRECAGKDETCPLYQQGLQSELRTNILFGVTGGAALATTVVGLLFTRWTSASAAVVPALGATATGGTAGLSGRF